MKNRFFGLMVSVICCACNAGTAKEESKKVTVRTDSAVTQQEDAVAKNVFSGSIPCVDCDSIQTVIALKADSTFEKSTTYMGVRDSTVKVAPQSGTWRMVADTVELIRTTAPNKFILRDSVLLQLDVLGQPVLNRKGDTVGLKRVAL